MSLELDIPYIGAVIASNNEQLEFFSSLEECGLSSIKRPLGSQRQELNMGKIGDACMLSREQVKNTLQAMAGQMVWLLLNLHYTGIYYQTRSDDSFGFQIK